MAYQEFIKTVRVRTGNDVPAINVAKTQGAKANKPLAHKIGLTKNRAYSIYVDRERKLIGLNVIEGGRYQASGSEKTNHVYVLAGVTAALQELGVDTSVPQIFPAVTINLPAPLVCQIDVSKAVMVKGGPK